MNDFYIEGLYVQKVADISGIPVEYVVKMRDRQLLDEQEVRNMLIRYDCHALLLTQKFTERQVYDRLAGIYNISSSQVQRIIKMKSKRIFYCMQCGHEITKAEFKRNGGMCDRCKSQSIIV
jgi:predicted Zn-ribbon and HTH transcriptional regulator|uniref:DNA-directed RNA polymerase n=1 Tax=Siphoviridae sp. ctAUQ2 TaxID=2826182 RepID=A0A8S5MZI0_9CAUD|nr:MAG TPA: DNA-directed RNA polymerase [Siphoviridae sp. ctAUQ2]